ncbi:MAG: galactose mutarotase [Alphaproteobacteria bacterium]|nr:galactose mutarotase [Alphaproteobacteria bacterium]
MSVSGRSAFGALADGTPVERIVIAGEGLSCAVITYGAAIQDLLVDGPAGPSRVVLGLARLEEYVRHSSHMGAVAGRFANRIKGGRFALDGIAYQLACNERGRTHLHGGPTGFGKRAWTVATASGRSVELALVSPGGDEGYPGRLEVRCCYRIAGPGRLAIELTAATDAPTIVNLATHSYFNLDGVPDARDHCLEIPADAYLPLDGDLIPSGEIRSVAGTPLDFRRKRPIGRAIAHDVTFAVARAPVAAPRRVARLEGPRSGIGLEVWTTEPGLQLFDAATIDKPVADLDGRRVAPYCGICLEPQRFPDSPNQPGFTDVVLRPGASYRQVTEYRFDRNGAA